MAEIDVKELQRMWKEACTCITNQDYANAAKLMKVLSCEGYSEAQYYLGRMYLNGLAVEKNLAEAFRLLSSAAHNGYAAAQFQIGGMYASGTYVAKDDLSAAWWLLRSAARGHAEAQFNLGRMFAAGIGVDKNAAEAIWWLHAAAEQGNANAKALLEKNKNPKAYTATLKEATVRAIRALAEKGYPYAMHSMGRVYSYAVTVSENSAEGQQWYQKAVPGMKKLAEQGDAEAQMRLFQMYRNGNGVAKDEKEDWRWLNAAAENGYAEAQETLGMNYNSMTPCNEKEAIRLWTLAARQGNPLAQVFLSNHTGYEESKFWLTRAAEQGVTIAMRNLRTYLPKEAAAYWEEKYEERKKEGAFIDGIGL